MSCSAVQVLDSNMVVVLWIPSFILVLITVTLLYAKMAHVAYKMSRKIQQLHNQVAGNHYLNHVTKWNQSKSQWKITKVLSVVIGVFIVTYVPAATVTVVAIYDETMVTGWTVATTTIIWIVNTFVNPIIYGFKTPDIKRAFRLLLDKERSEVAETVVNNGNSYQT